MGAGWRWSLTDVRMDNSCVISASIIELYKVALLYVYGNTDINWMEHVLIYHGPHIDSFVAFVLTCMAC